MRRARAHSARVRFRNGDELAINLNGLNANAMQMETWFAGSYRFLASI